MFRDGSSVEVFGWNSSNVFANNALNSDFYAKYRRIEPEQATQMPESSLGYECMYKIQTFNDNVRSLVHCKI